MLNYNPWEYIISSHYISLILFRVSGIYRGKGRIWGCERAYACSHPHIRESTPEIRKEPLFT